MAGRAAAPNLLRGPLRHHERTPETAFGTIRARMRIPKIPRSDLHELLVLLPGVLTRELGAAGSARSRQKEPGHPRQCDPPLKARSAGVSRRCCLVRRREPLESCLAVRESEVAIFLGAEPFCDRGEVLLEVPVAEPGDTIDRHAASLDETELLDEVCEVGPVVVA